LNKAGHRKGWHITFKVQSAESPDLNKSYLCLSTVSSLNRRDPAKEAKIEEPMVSVENAFGEDDNDKVARVQSLTSAIFREIMEDNGGNQCQTPLSEFQKKTK
jgi:hypothetical protein